VSSRSTLFVSIDGLGGHPIRPSLACGWSPCRQARQLAAALMAAAAEVEQTNHNDRIAMDS